MTSLSVFTHTRTFDPGGANSASTQLLINLIHRDENPSPTHEMFFHSTGLIPLLALGLLTADSALSAPTARDGSVSSVTIPLYNPPSHHPRFPGEVVRASVSILQIPTSNAGTSMFRWTTTTPPLVTLALQWQNTLRMPPRSLAAFSSIQVPQFSHLLTVLPLIYNLCRWTRRIRCRGRRRHWSRF